MNIVLDVFEIPEEIPTTIQGRTEAASNQSQKVYYRDEENGNKQGPLNSEAVKNIVVKN